MKSMQIDGTRHRIHRALEHDYTDLVVDNTDQRRRSKNDLRYHYNPRDGERKAELSARIMYIMNLSDLV